MKFSRVNNIAGWVVFAIATTVYLMTMEASASFWDCGEFIAACYKLQIPHPPGAPLFVMLGKFFIILFGNDPATAAKAVNSMSAVVSGFTILFLFWSVTHFAQKLLRKNDEPFTMQQTVSIIGSGIVGALAYTFSDSFWYSAVEGEVYALSSFFTALVFWAVLKWERQADQPYADRWLVFIFYAMGLSIGVHLLNLLSVPAIVMVYYFRKYKPSLRGSILAFVIGCTITGIVQKFLIQSTIKGAGSMDVYFVNSLGLPFFSGFAFFFLLLAAGLVWAIRYAARKRKPVLKLALWSMGFMLLGYSTYLTTMIRSNANPAVDMFNVDNPVSLAGYLGRDQYNDWPILYGPDFTDRPPYVEGGPRFAKFEKSYVNAGNYLRQDWSNTPSAHFFPRMWDNSDDRQQQLCYRSFTGLDKDEAPSMKDNIAYFTRYQAGWMYFRYFMWNFAGKQNDLQGFGNARDSNWVSGIQFIDNKLYGNQSALPETIKGQNASNNKLYLLPLALGIAGFLFQYKRKRRDLVVNGLLFFFTGLAVVIYLNQSGYQPRERDYAYVGSFYAFAIWIGIGVLAVAQLLQRLIKTKMIAAYGAVGLCLLAVPVLMACQEWDDHDRSNKTLATDMARNYLESCPPNAILFTAEDNDTYVLWYLQEVENVRPDVRVVVSTIFSADWYINQLRYKVNKSDPFDVIFSPEQIRGSNRDVVYFDKVSGYNSNQYYDLYNTLKQVTGSDAPEYTRQTEDGILHLLPDCKYTIPVDLNTVENNGTVMPGDSVVSELRFDLSSKRYLFKNDLAQLSVIAANQWKRPICFTSDRTAADLGLDKYTRLDGMTYRLVPVENSKVNNEAAYKNIMEKFRYGKLNAGKPVYYDEENRRRMNYIRLAHAQVAIGLAQAGRREEARKVLERMDQQVSETDFPYGMTSNRGNMHNAFTSEFLRACYFADDKALAKKVTASMQKDLRAQLNYYRSLGDETMTDEQLVTTAYALMQGKGGDMPGRQIEFVNDILSSWQLLQQTTEWEKQQ